MPERDDPTLTRAGFSLPPPPAWEKTDPRGPEYGKFVAKRVGNDIVVYHTSDDYEMTFKVEISFLNWAKACT